MAQPNNTSMPQALVALTDGVNAPPVDIGNAIVSEIHESAVPGHAVTSLDRLYGSMYASLRHLQLCGEDRPTPHTWIGYRRGEIVGVLLFRIRNTRVLVLTEMFALDEEIAEAFCSAVFSRFSCAGHITFNAVSVSRPLHQLTQQSFAFSENYVIRLPSSVDAYLDALGKSTRKTIRGYGNRLLREVPGFRWEARPASELRRDEQRRLVRRLQEFKQASMASRGKRAAIDRHDTARLLKLASECGLFGIATVNGRVVGGSLACRFGDNYTMLLSAADPALESHRLGLLCCYWSVCDCIRAGARECHLLWGRYRYKSQLLGELFPLYRVNVYRSRLHAALAPALLLRMAAMRVRHACRNWLLIRLQERNNLTARAVGWGFAWLRAAAARVQEWRSH